MIRSIEGIKDLLRKMKKRRKRKKIMTKIKKKWFMSRELKLKK